VGKIVLSTTGPAEWAVTLGGGAVNFGRGRRVVLGPELMQPMDQLAVTVSGGPPSAAILGSLNGVSGTLDEVLAHFTPQSNTIAVDTSAVETVLGTVAVPAQNGGASVGPLNFPLPAGTQCVGLAWSAAGANNAPTIAVVSGHQTAIAYINLSALPNNSAVQAVIVDSRDTSIDVSFTGRSNVTSSIDVLAWSNQPAVFIEQAPGSTISVDARTLVPAPWQAPTTDAGILDATGTNPAILVAGVANQIIRVWSWKLEFGVTGAARFAGLRGSTRVQFDGCFASTWSPAAGSFVENGNAGGIPLASGSSLLLDTTAAAGETVRAAVGYSQA
jgi:hypothetical protein